MRARWVLGSCPLVALLVTHTWAAPPGPPALGPAQRNPTGYDWSLLLQANADANGAVTAMADASDGLLVAHGPTYGIERVDVMGAASNEAKPMYSVSSISAGAGGVFAATCDLAAAGAGDVFQRTSAGWVSVLDNAASCAVVFQAGREVLALTGDLDQDGAVHTWSSRSGWVSDAAALPGTLPSAGVEHRRAVWVGGGSSAATGGPAKLFLGKRGSFSEVALADPNPAPGAGERQKVTALASGEGFLIVALGTFDVATGNALRGQILLIGDGRRPETVQALNLTGEAPLALAQADGSLYVGTSAGRLLHVDSNGAWADEPGIPANMGIRSLVARNGVLFAGLQTATGAQVLARLPKAAPPPLAPSSLVAAAPTSAAVDLTWQDNSNDETGFRIERSPAGMNTFAAVGNVGANTQTYKDGSVAPETNYDYRVLAVRGMDVSAPSNTATIMTPKALTPPLAPSALTATAIAATRIDLAWQDNSNDETGFRVERSPGGQNAFQMIASLPANAKAYVDETVVAATSYSYRVIALNGALASQPSNVATVMTPAVVTATYLADVKPILNGKNLLMLACWGCHTNRQYKLSANLADDTADYTSTLKYIDMTTPANSELLRRATQQAGHPVKMLNVGSPEYNKIVEWIQGGAKFN